MDHGIRVELGAKELASDGDSRGVLFTLEALPYSFQPTSNDVRRWGYFRAMVCDHDQRSLQ